MRGVVFPESSKIQIIPKTDKEGYGYLIHQVTMWFFIILGFVGCLFSIGNSLTSLMYSFEAWNNPKNKTMKKIRKINNDNIG